MRARARVPTVSVAPLVDLDSFSYPPDYASGPGRVWLRHIARRRANEDQVKGCVSNGTGSRGGHELEIALGASTDVRWCGRVRQREPVAGLATLSAEPHERLFAEVRARERIERGRVVADDDEHPVGHPVGRASNLLLRCLGNRRRLVPEQMSACKAGPRHQ